MVSTTVTSGREVDQSAVAILGYDHDTRKVLSACLRFGFKPIAVHAPIGGMEVGSTTDISQREAQALIGENEEINSLQDENFQIPVVGGDEFRQIVADRNIPVIVGAYGVRDRDYFKEHLLFGRHKLNLTGRILHPAFFCGLYNFNHRRFAITGFPGSGNMIVQSLAQRILGRSPELTSNGSILSKLITTFAISYWYSLRGYLSSQFDDLGRSQDHAGPSHTRYGTFDIVLRDESSFISIAGLPLGSYAWSNPLNTSHEPLTEFGLSFFKKQEFEPIQIVRHPLDIVVSNAAKITSLSGNRAPQLLLQNEAWMRGMFSILERYYTGIVENSKTVPMIRYEELLSSPVVTMRKIAELLGADIADDECLEIWDELRGRTFSDGHYWDPRAGKWREFISPRFADRVEVLRLRKLANALGYQFEPEDFVGNRGQIPSGETKCFDVAWWDARWEASTGKEPAITHEDVYRVLDTNRGLLLISRRKYADSVDRILHSSVFESLLQASNYREWTEESLIAEYLGIR